MLWNKDGNGTAELKTYIGFLYASNNFNNIATDINLAEEEIKEIIGTPVYNLAHDHYYSDNYNSEDSGSGSASGSGSGSGSGASNDLLDELIGRIRLPVALLAYKSFSENADLSHEDTGRKIKIDPENEKPAFEWMLERDDAATLRKANKNIDRLIAFLEEHEDSISEWKNSEAQQTARSLFINTAKQFNEYYPIDNSRMFYIKILPFIKEAERVSVKPVITPDLFDEIKNEIKSDNLSTTNTDILEYIRYALSLQSMFIAVKRLAIEVLPESLVRDYINRLNMSREVLSRARVKKEIADHLEIEAKKRLSDLQELLTKNDEGSGYDPEITDFDTNDEDNLYYRT